MKINLSKKDIVWSYIGTVLSMGSNMIMLPFIVYYLDSDMLGLWYVFSSVGAVATLFDFGFATTFARNITYCWSGARKLKKEDVEFTEIYEPDYRLMKNVLGTCRLIYLIISSVALLLLLTLGTTYIHFISREIPGKRHIIAWIIYAVGVFLNLYYGYYASFLRGVGAVDIANQNIVIARMTQIIMVIVMLTIGMGIVGVSAGYLVYGTLFRMLGKYRFYRYRGIGEHLENTKVKTDFKELYGIFRTVWHNAWREGLVMLANYFSNQAGTVICSLYLTLSETGIYSIGVQMATAIANIAGTLYSTYQPALQEAYVCKNKEKTKKIMSLIVVVYVLLFIAGTIGVIVILPLLRLLKADLVLPIPIFLGLCMYQFMLKFRNCYTSYFSCTNRLPYVKGFLTSALLCVVLSVFMTGILSLGIVGLIAAQIISQGVYNVWVWPIRAHREMGLTVKMTIQTGIQEIKTGIKKFNINFKQ